MEEQKNKETLEELFGSLETVIRQTEEADTSLEDSFELYNKVLVLDEDGETHEF